MYDLAVHMDYKLDTQTVCARALWKDAGQTLKPEHHPGPPLHPADTSRKRCTVCLKDLHRELKLSS